MAVRRRSRTTALRFVLLFVTSSIALAACASPGIIRETPESRVEPAPTATPVSVVPVPTPTQAIELRSFEIERVVLATTVDESGAPLDERSDFPQSPEQMFLCVQIRNVQQGDRFRSYWLEGGQVIGQSDRLALETSAEPVWIALGYQPISHLNPSADHAVELLINDQRIERYMFRVGVGDIEHVVAAAAFATGFDEAGKPVGVQNVFPADAAQLRLLVRVSNQVDPTGMLFTTVWYRGDTRLAQLSPDPPPATDGAPPANPRRLSFTFEPSQRLVPGAYRVAVLINGTEVRSVSFKASSGARSGSAPMARPGAVPPQQPAPPETDADQATDSNVRVDNLMIVRDIDPETQAPVGDPVFALDGVPEEVFHVWLAASVSDLRQSDVVEVRLLRGEELVAVQPLPPADLESGWLAAPVDVVVPPVGTSSVVYTAAVNVNGVTALTTSLEVRGPVPP